MDKPRFPLSVRHEFWYRAVIDDTGEILMCEAFKDLFRVVRAHLRTAVHWDDCEGFSISGAVFEYGFDTIYEMSPGHSVSEWTRQVGFGYMYVSSLSEVYCRFQDNKQCVLRGGSFV